MRAAACLRYLLVGAALSAALAGAARAEIPEGKFKLGILSSLTDADYGGLARSDLAAAQMAAEQFEAQPTWIDVEIHVHYGGKPQEQVGVVRDWLDKEHVDAVLDLTPSSADAELGRLLAEHDRTLIVVNGDGARIGANCAQTTLTWGAGPAAVGTSLARAVLQRGRKTWFLIAGQENLDPRFAQATAQAVTAAGGTVLGEADHPVGTADFTPLLQQAAQSGAQVLALAESGPDLGNLVRQAATTAVGTGRMTVGLSMRIRNVDQIGLSAAQGMLVATPYYWDRNDASRTFRRRFAARTGGRMPGETEASAYAAVRAILHAAQESLSVDAHALFAALRRQPIQDPLFGAVTVRADGVATHDMPVFRVKRPDQAQQRWDYYELFATVAAEEAFPPAPSGCREAKP